MHGIALAKKLWCVSFTCLHAHGQTHTHTHIHRYTHTHTHTYRDWDTHLLHGHKTPMETKNQTQKKNYHDQGLNVAILALTEFSLKIYAPIFKEKRKIAKNHKPLLFFIEDFFWRTKVVRFYPMDKALMDANETPLKNDIWDQCQVPKIVNLSAKPFPVNLHTLSRTYNNKNYQ